MGIRPYGGRRCDAMAENPYNDGRLNIGAAAQVKALHKRPGTDKAKVLKGNDLRAGKGK